MSDNNWITPKWISDLLSRKGYRYYVTDSFWVDKEIAAEINKEIKNILESAEKRDCKTCKRSQYTINCQECLACYFETKKTYPNWALKEGK